MGWQTWSPWKIWIGKIWKIGRKCHRGGKRTGWWGGRRRRKNKLIISNIKACRGRVDFSWYRRFLETCRFHDVICKWHFKRTRKFSWQKINIEGFRQLCWTWICSRSITRFDEEKNIVGWRKNVWNVEYSAYGRTGANFWRGTFQPDMGIIRWNEQLCNPLGRQFRPIYAWTNEFVIRRQTQIGKTQ